MEVVMRPPQVFVRPLARGEAVMLKRRAKRAMHFSTRQRASIRLASDTGMTAPEIASMWQTDESHVRKVIHEFNERGLDSLDPDYRGGRPRRITAEVRKRIVAVAGARPDTLGEPFTPWSLPQLAAYLRTRGICRSRPPTSGACSPRPACPFSARAPGRRVPTPTTRPRQHAFCRSTSGLLTVAR
jgi:transposase